MVDRVWVHRDICAKELMAVGMPRVTCQPLGARRAKRTTSAFSPGMSKPFSDLTFCCTGIDTALRIDLAAKISELGGVFDMDLMSLVNVLVVGSRRTEKYKYSVRFRHDIHFIEPASIHNLYSRWKEGHAVSASDVKKHHLGVFSNFTVCVARVEAPSAQDRARYMEPPFRSPPAYARPLVVPEDVFRPDDLINTMVKLGANVSLTLTPACSVVVGLHCSGKRYTMAREWGIPTVHPVWVLDLCLRGAALEPADYELTESPNYYAGGAFSWLKLYASRAARAEPLPFRDRERPSLKKSSHVWSSIMDSSAAPRKQVQDSTWEPDLSAAESAAQRGSRDESPSRPRDESPSDSRDSARDSSLFSGFTFFPVGLSHAHQAVLHNVVESHLGCVAKSADDHGVLHIVVLSNGAPLAINLLQQLPKSLRRRINDHTVRIVSNWFIERCVYYNEICYDSWSKPLHGAVPLLQRLKVCLTGFTGVELLHIEKLISLLNFECCPVLNARRDLLVVNINLLKPSLVKSCPQLFEYEPRDVVECPIYNTGHGTKSIAAVSAKNKINAAKKWHIPIVSLAYIWEMVKTLEGLPNLNLCLVSDQRWCIHAPLVSSTKQPTSKAPPVSTDAPHVQLPSPRKSKEKHKYGRLVGGGESLTEKLKLARSDPHELPCLSDKSSHPLDSDNDCTQVGYGNAESLKGSNDLMEKLEDLDRPSKRTRRR